MESKTRSPIMKELLWECCQRYSTTNRRTNYCLSTSHAIWKFNDSLDKGPPRLALSLGSTDCYLEGYFLHWLTQAKELSNVLLCSVLLGSHKTDVQQAPGMSAQKSCSFPTGHSTLLSCQRPSCVHPQRTARSY